MFTFGYHFRWICRLCDMEHSNRIIRCNASSKLIGTRLSITSVSSVAVRPAAPGGGSPEINGGGPLARNHIRVAGQAITMRQFE